MTTPIEHLYDTEQVNDQRGMFLTAGAPTNGTSGTLAGYAYKGAVLVDKTNAKPYLNTNTTASPTWTPLAFVYSNAGAPTNGGAGTFAGYAAKGALLSDTTNGVYYVNVGTLGTPLWSPLGFTFTNAGAPVDGTTLANVAAKGSILVDTTTPNIYINVNTLASPTWKLITRAA